MDIITTAANTIDLTPICEAIIALLAAVITMYLIPWIKSKTNEQQQRYIYTAARIVVYAMEKIYGAGNGDVKFAQAQKVLEQEYGIRLDIAQLKTVVNAVIKEMEQAEPTLLMTTGELDTTNEQEGEAEDEEPQRKDAPEGA